jgi:hypothetical protein
MKFYILVLFCCHFLGHVYFSTFVFANESWLFLCSFKFHFLLAWYGAAKINHTRKVAKLPQSAPAVLNGRCRSRLDMSRSSLGFVLRGLPARGRSVTFSVIIVRKLENKVVWNEHFNIAKWSKTIMDHRQQPFSTPGALRGNLAFGGHISTRTVIRRLHHQGMRARWPIKRPQLTLHVRHRHARFDHCHCILTCQITIKNIQVQLTVKGKTTPDSYTPSPKSSCAQNVVVTN